MSNEPRYVRYQATKANRRGTFPGVFGLANGLAHEGRLTQADYSWWRDANDWCNEAYPDPSSTFPLVYDSTLHPGAQAWFKCSARHLLAKVDGYLDLLSRYGVGCERISSSDPGKVIYEDDVQIVVVPQK